MWPAFELNNDGCGLVQRGADWGHRPAAQMRRRSFTKASPTAGGSSSNEMSNKLIGKRPGGVRSAISTPGHTDRLQFCDEMEAKELADREVPCSSQGMPALVAQKSLRPPVNLGGRSAPRDGRARCLP